MIPVLDLKAQYRAIERDINEAIQRILVSTEFVLGPAVKELEQAVAAYCACSHGVGVASGTDALRLALGALGVGPGDEVITTPFTFIATASTISHTGATPVFVDIDPVTYNIDPSAIAKAITPRTKAILPVHLYGHPADMDPIMELATRHKLYVLEDCAQAIGARYKGRRVGSIGHAGALSFYPTKNLGAYGDGGMVVTNDADLAGKIDVLRRQGSKRKYHADILGFNSRLDAIQAAVLSVKLRHLDDWNERRRQLARGYETLLAGSGIKAPKTAGYAEHVFHQYTVEVGHRDQVAKALSDQQIGTMIYYPVPIHRQSLYEDPSRKGLPHSEAAAKQVLSLPMYPELTAEQQERVVAALRSAV